MKFARLEPPEGDEPELEVTHWGEVQGPHALFNFS